MESLETRRILQSQRRKPRRSWMENVVCVLLALRWRETRDCHSVWPSRTWTYSARRSAHVS